MDTKIITHWKGNSQFESDNPSGKTVLIDTSAEHGGHDSGLRPKAMMLSALAGCSGLDVVSVLEKMKVKISDFRMDIDAQSSEEHPMIYHTVSLEYHFFGDNLNEDKIKKAVDLSVEKYCGVMEMFRRFATVNTSIHYHNK